MAFAKDFVWGAAAASYQVEGAVREDGRGDSVWDEFCRWEGKIWHGHTGEVACDHYHRYAEDVAAMKQMGLKAYRLSIAWPRVLPEGVGAVNEKGLAFYDRLIDALLAAGVQPWVTLFHWDYPLALYRRGGWLNRQTVEWFGEYTQAVVDRLSDRVRHWFTLNEPQVFVGHGHAQGTHAPGLQLPLAQQLLVGHHVLMAHGRAVQVIRARSKSPPQVGWAPVGGVRYPATDSEADRRAAWVATTEMHEPVLWNNAWFAEPVVFGRYPATGVKLFGKDMPPVQEGDLELIRQPLDFYGMNCYLGTAVRAGEGGKPQPVPRPVGYPISLYDWAVEPRALYWGPKFLHEKYKLPIVITENGISNMDWVSLDGAVHDPQRIDYMHRYLRELRRAADDGVPVLGYFHWSILDNFEWHHGYKHRFGLIHVDFNTLKRTPKDSARWYAEVIRTNGANL